MPNGTHVPRSFPELSDRLLWKHNLPAFTILSLLCPSSPLGKLLYWAPLLLLSLPLFRSPSVPPARQMLKCPCGSSPQKGVFQ